MLSDTVETHNNRPTTGLSCARRTQEWPVGQDVLVCCLCNVPGSREDLEKILDSSLRRGLGPFDGLGFHEPSRVGRSVPLLRSGPLVATSFAHGLPPTAQSEICEAVQPLPVLGTAAYTGDMQHTGAGVSSALQAWAAPGTCLEPAACARMRVGTLADLTGRQSV